MIFTIIEILLLLTIIIVQIKQKYTINNLEDELYQLQERLWWDLQVDKAVYNIQELKEKYDETNKRGILGESDRSNEHENIERNRAPKHSIWT